MMKHVLIVLWFIVLVGCVTTKQITKESDLTFSNEQKALIMSGDTLIPMRVFLITNQSDSTLLRTPCEKVTADPNDPVLQQLVKRMFRTVRDSLSMGVGIAAPQVGILKNIIWVQRLDKENMPFEVYLNPVINEYSERKRPCREGCLSIPIRRDTTTTRAFEILVEYDRLDGSHNEERVQDFTSVIFQHEIDHLNGILYIDHLKAESKTTSDEK